MFIKLEDTEAWTNLKSTAAVAPQRVSRGDTYVTLLLGHFHGMFHVWGLQHDGVVGFPFLLDKLLFVICLKRARITYVSGGSWEQDWFTWRTSRSSPGKPLASRFGPVWNPGLSVHILPHHLYPTAQHWNHTPIFGEMITGNLSSVMHHFYLFKNRWNDIGLIHYDIMIINALLVRP